MASPFLPDELARALASFRECYRVASAAGHRVANQKDLLRLFDWIADGAEGARAPQAVEGEETLEHARADLQAKLNGGLTCPCCDQFAKVYKRKLNSCMAQALIHIYQFFEVVGKEDPDAYVHVPAFLVRTMGTASIAGGDVTKLRYWGLLEARPEARADGSARQGFYRITERGKAFVRNEVRVPSHVYLYNQECLRFSDELILITEALQEDFDYGELMRPA